MIPGIHEAKRRPLLLSIFRWPKSNWLRTYWSDECMATFDFENVHFLGFFGFWNSRFPVSNFPDFQARDLKRTYCTWLFARRNCWMPGCLLEALTFECTPKIRNTDDILIVTAQHHFPVLLCYIYTHGQWLWPLCTCQPYHHGWIAASAPNPVMSCMRMDHQERTTEKCALF